MFHRLLYKHALAKADPEQAHETAMRLIGAFERPPSARLDLATIGYLGSGRLRDLLARPVPDRLGLAAGWGKNATAVLGTIAMGLAFTEVGTVTPPPQPGNDRPRLWRLPEEHTFRNRMGFNNDGADTVAKWFVVLRLTRRGRVCVIGVGIGGNKWVETTGAPIDYAVCARKLVPCVDYSAVNVSSPNISGLRGLRAAKSLRPIMHATCEIADLAVDCRVLILVKIAPDFGNTDVDGVADLVVKEKTDGVAAMNTTVAHSHGEGGLSGEPVRARALEIVSRLRKRLGPDYTVIGVRGVLAVSNAEAVVSAGADLLEALTGLVYEGPLISGQINRTLARKQPSVRLTFSRKQTSSRKWGGRSDCQQAD